MKTLNLDPGDVISCEKIPEWPLGVGTRGVGEFDPASPTSVLTGDYSVLVEGRQQTVLRAVVAADWRIWE